jgi:glycosyltransferase involved in cell wall biosynthesis
MSPATPLVSVVMGVRNGAPGLEATLASLTRGQDLDLEVIVINDGSTDRTGPLLAELADQDPRIRVLERQGRGLTRSLIEGCSLARGTYIARQDAGDRSLPSRLRRQVELLESDPSASLCSTHVRLVVEEGATAVVNRFAEESLADGLTGPAIHGSVLMRRQAYEQAGGYRPAFYFAQDLDLWSRMVEQGRHRVVPEVLYEATLSPGSISGSRRQEQQAFHALIVGASRARRHGEPETPWLEKAEQLSARCRTARPDRRRQAEGAYFIASCLAAEHPLLSRQYLGQTLHLDPWHLRARLRHLKGALGQGLPGRADQAR